MGAYDCLPGCSPYDYSYSDLGNWPLYDFNMEQQAEIVSHHYTSQIPVQYQGAAAQTIGTFDTQGPGLFGTLFAPVIEMYQAWQMAEICRPGNFAP